MARYEVVREIENQCANNQMRDVVFREIECEDPVQWVKNEIRGREVHLSVDEKQNGDLTVFAESAGLVQKFLFTRL